MMQWMLIYYDLGCEAKKFKILHDSIRPPGLYGFKCVKSLSDSWFLYLASYKSGQVAASTTNRKVEENHIL
jgi:hypothetical protein